MTKDKPIIAAFSLGWDSACPIIRMTGPCRSAGITLRQGDHDNFPDQIEGADLVVIQRDFPFYRDAFRAVVDKARSLNKPIVYETDDLILETPPELPQYKLYRDARTGVLRALLEADAVITSTEELKTKLFKHNPNIFVLNNYLEDDLWRLRTPKIQAAADRVSICYVGSASHSPDIEVITPALLEILQKYGEKVSITFWGVQPSASLLVHAGVRWIDQSVRSYVSFVELMSDLDIDIAIAPLKDHEFNRCKSHIKFLEYSAMGAAGVYSDLPPYNRIVAHNKNGMLANTPNEWTTSICALIDSPKLRREIAAEAQLTVQNHWLMSQQRTTFEKLFSDLISVEQRKTNELQEYMKLVDGWYEELKYEADDLRDLAANLDRSRAWKLLEKWWNLREKVGLPASTPPEHRRRAEKS